MVYNITRTFQAILLYHVATYKNKYEKIHIDSNMKLKFQIHIYSFRSIGFLTSLLTIRKDTKEINLFVVYKQWLLFHYIMFSINNLLSTFLFLINVRSKYSLLKWRLINQILKKSKYTLHSNNLRRGFFFYAQQCNLLYGWHTILRWKASLTIDKNSL